MKPLKSLPHGFMLQQFRATRACDDNAGALMDAAAPQISPAPPPQENPERVPDRASFALSRVLFIRMLGLVYCCAFASMWGQVRGLFGSRGVLPIAEYLQAAHDQIGADAYWRLPTLFWFNQSDTALVGLCAAGTILAILVVVGIAPIVILPLLWAMYLSIVSAGQDFLGFQWDWLLLEAGFIAIFFAPPRVLLWKRPREPSRAIRWLILWLLFRLMFSAGAVKLLSRDPTWRDLSAMRYHYFTQPIPAWSSWYMHQLPPAFHSAETLFTFFSELFVPFLIFGPRVVRRAGFILLTALQLIIMATGNFGFFNLLTIALSVPLLDDAFFSRRFPKPQPEARAFENAGAHTRWQQWALAAVGVVLGLISLVPFLGTLGFVGVIPSPLRRAYIRAQPFGLASSYGLFAVMTTKRLEIIIEGSDDGVTWRPYEFKYKPGDVNRPPPLIGPHMPRLDWQMWFAALGDYQENPWLGRLLDRLLEGSPDVLGLLAYNPFPNAPPRYIRARGYDYHFTDFSTHRTTGAWWQRTEVGLYAPTRQRDELNPTPP